MIQLGSHEKQPEVKIAEAQANVTIQKAVGESSAITQNGRADATVITSYVQSELESYSRIKKSLGFSITSSGFKLSKFVVKRVQMKSKLH